jgi:hypothetical protein
MLLVDDLLFGLPAKGLLSIFTKVCEMAQLELTDESRIKEELLQLQTLYEIDEITDEEYQEKEAALLERLMVAEGV